MIKDLPEIKADCKSEYPRTSGPCWDILYRTPYFCVPKMVLIGMPIWWQKIFVWLISMMPITPTYSCQRKDKMGRFRGNDPWANYRHGNVADCLEDVD